MGDKSKLECLLKEAELIQSEMNARLERHANSFYYTILVITGVLAAGVALLAVGKTGSFLACVVIASLSITLPWFTTPLAAMFFDDELWRSITDYYVDSVLAVRINDCLIYHWNHEADLRPAFHTTLQSRLKFLHKLSELEIPTRQESMPKEFRQKRFGLPPWISFQKKTQKRVSQFPKFKGRRAANTRIWIFKLPFFIAFLGSLLLAYLMLWYPLPGVSSSQGIKTSAPLIHSDSGGSSLEVNSEERKSTQDDRGLQDIISSRAVQVRTHYENIAILKRHPYLCSCLLAAALLLIDAFPWMRTRAMLRESQAIWEEMEACNMPPNLLGLERLR